MDAVAEVSRAKYEREFAETATGLGDAIRKVETGPQSSDSVCGSHAEIRTLGLLSAKGVHALMMLEQIRMTHNKPTVSKRTLAAVTTIAAAIAAGVLRAIPWVQGWFTGP